MRRIFISLGLIAALSLSVSGVTQAHHYMAEYDREHPFKVTGTVKDFQWTNPHSWLIVVFKEKGKTRQLALELASPSLLKRRGLQRNSMKPGDVVVVWVAPRMGHPDEGGLTALVSINGKPGPGAFEPQPGEAPPSAAKRN